MKRMLVLVAAVSCSSPAERPEPSIREIRLRALEEAANRATSFRAFYEFRDESTGEAALLELAFRAPDCGKLLYPGSHSVYFAEGVCRFFIQDPRATFYEVPYLEELRLVEDRFSEAIRIAAEIRGEPLSPHLVFDLGGWVSIRSLATLKTLLMYSYSPSRFGWFRSLRDSAYDLDGDRTFRSDGDGIARPSVEMVLEEHGFLSKVRILPLPGPGRLSHPGFILTLQTLSLESPPDEVFSPPRKGDAPDKSAEAVERLRSTLSDSLERFLVELLAERWAEIPRDRAQALLAAYYRADLERSYDPAGMVRIVREGQEKTLAFARSEIETSPDRSTALQQHLQRIRTQREANLAQIDELEERIRQDYHRFLVRILRDLSAAPACREGIKAVSDAGLSQVLREVLREPVSRIFDELSAALEKE